MSALELISIALLLSAIYYIIVVTFPENYKKGSARKKINLLLIISTAIYVVVAVFLLRLNKHIEIVSDVDFKTALLFVPLISIFLFSANIYYPSIRVLAKVRDEDLNFADEILECVFEYKYKNVEERGRAIEKIKGICSSHSKQLKQVGLEKHMNFLIEQSQGPTLKASAPLIDFCEQRCVDLYKSIEENSLMPFSNISMVSSFSLSYILTIVLTYVTIM